MEKNKTVYNKNRKKTFNSATVFFAVPVPSLDKGGGEFEICRIQLTCS
jgi:hypothetical protein